jgi:hypothetical protein
MKISVFVLLIGCVVFFSQQVYSKIITNVAPDISSEEIRAIVVEDFEATGEWEIKTVPKQLTKNTGKNGKKNPVPILEMKFVNGSPADLQVEKWTEDKRGMKKNQCLGVHFMFKYPGHNAVHIIPPKPIRMPGRTKGLSLWVHGRGKAYTLEAWIKDYNGSVHILKFRDEKGVRDVNFVGWKPMKTYVPAFVPQEIESYPQTKTITIERFVLRADPKEKVAETYFFFDQLKALSETFEVNFDGKGLEDAFKGSQKGDTTTTPETTE